MPMTLSSAQVESYSRGGFVSPIAALTRVQAAECRAEQVALEGR